MNDLAQKTEYYQLPLAQDLNKKSTQRKLREMTTNCTEELFEALAELKSWRVDEYKERPEVDREAYIHELMDAQNYLFSMMILAGLTEDEFMRVYEENHEKNMQRLHRK